MFDIQLLILYTRTDYCNLQPSLSFNLHPPEHLEPPDLDSTNHLDPTNYFDSTNHFNPTKHFDPTNHFDPTKHFDPINDFDPINYPELIEKNNSTLPSPKQHDGNGEISIDLYMVWNAQAP